MKNTYTVTTAVWLLLGILTQCIHAQVATNPVPPTVAVRAGALSWNLAVGVSPTVPFYACNPGPYTFNFTATPQGVRGGTPPRTTTAYTIGSPTWTWRGATVNRTTPSTAVLTRNFPDGPTNVAVSATVTYPCTPIGGGSCPPANQLTRTGSKTLLSYWSKYNSSSLRG
jgi:hypothetical protein